MAEVQTNTDAGEIEINKRARIGGVAQEAPATEISVLETVMAAVDTFALSEEHLEK